MNNIRKNFIYIYFFVLMVGAGQSIVFAIFPPLARDLSITEFQVGLIISSAAFISFLSSMFWGRSVDHSGSKSVLIAGVIGYALFNIFFAGILWYALVVPLNLLVMIALLLITRCLFAIFSAAIMPAAQTYLINNTTSEERPSKMAMIGMMFGLGMILGPAGASAIVSWGILLPLILSSLIMLLPLPFSINAIQNNIPTIQKSKPIQEKIQFFDKRLRTSAVLMCVIFIIFSAIQQTIGFFIQDINQISTIETAKWVSLAFTISAITSVICQGVIIQRWKPSSKMMINFGVVALLLTLSILFLSSGIIMVFIAFVFFGISNGFVYPGIISQASQRCGLHIQGQVTAILQAAMSLGFIAGPLIGSGLYPYIKNQLYLVLLCLLIVCLLYVYLNDNKNLTTLNKQNT